MFNSHNKQNISTKTNVGVCKHGS